MCDICAVTAVWESWPTWCPVDHVWCCKGPNLLPHSLDQVLADVLTVVVSFMQSHVCIYTLTLDVMVKPAQGSQHGYKQGLGFYHLQRYVALFMDLLTCTGIQSAAQMSESHNG